MTVTKSDKIYVAGHNGLVGSAIVRNLIGRGYTNIVQKTRSELDLIDEKSTYKFLSATKPEVIILAAAEVGGIHANNTYRTEFLLNNLKIQNSVIGSANALGIPNLIFLGSSCIYPREAPQPMGEDCLLTGPLEMTNRPYALAKIAGLELVNCIRTQYKRNYFSVMPTNLYGPGDSFHPENSHVLPALLRKFVEAKEQNSPLATVWGTGNPLREFMFVDDCADAIVHLMEAVCLESLQLVSLASKGWSHINVGSEDEISIAKLAHVIANIVGFKGVIKFDASKPDGTLRKLLDTSLLRNAFKWKSKTSLSDGLAITYRWYLENNHKARG